MIQSDFHLHSFFSGDSDASTEDMVQRGIRLGLKTMCFTEHYDADYPEGCGDFSLDAKRYHQEMLRLKEQYADQIELLFGVELGMQAHLGEHYTEWLPHYPFDFVIASQHLLEGQDPYYPAFWSGRRPEDAICLYFEETLRNLRRLPSWDTLGHLDYIVRYAGPARDTFSYVSYMDGIDPILRYLIEQGKCLEVNSAGLKYGLGHPNPREDILRRYRELGGERITVGSDAHCPEHIAWEFDKIESLLRELGFRYLCLFRQRICRMVKI